MFGGITFAGATFAGVLGVLQALPPPSTEVGINIGGYEATNLVRHGSVTIRDVLNDAPNTCTFVMEREAPAVGQRIRITVGSWLLFAGAIQTVDASYESLPVHRAWQVTAIDDTAEANARRPFGTWFDTSATTVALTIAAAYAPGFSTAGIQPGLPLVTIVFDGADPFIACLARLATAVGGYCKVEDRTVYLFTEDLEDSPNPIDAAHRFLTSPPIQKNVDASQLRTRVYGKGYGEAVQAAIAAGETLLPIEDGAIFPALGGTAIVSLTPDGAQSEKIAFTGVVRQSGESLVGTGSSPGSAPGLALAGGAGVDPGLHTVAVAYRTALGGSLAGPPAAITAGTHAPPATAPVAATALPGTGPDQGWHDYAASYVTAYGETVPGPIGNAIETSASVGQLPPPSAAGMTGSQLQGAGLDTGDHDYKTTLLNANGETEAGANSPSFLAQPTDPVAPIEGGGNGFGTTTAGASMAPGDYVYFQTWITAAGETTTSVYGWGLSVRALDNSGVVPLAVHPDPRVIGRKLYRGSGGLTPSAACELCATITNNTATTHLDTVSQASIAGHAHPPTVNTTAVPMNRLALTGIPTGPAGTTGRRLYRRYQTTGTWKFVTTIGNNTATTYTDATPNSALGVEAPTSNTTGTAVQRVPVSNIPIGPSSVTARKLYRRFNVAGAFKLVTTLANNTGTSYTDAVPNAALGAEALAFATAVGNQIRVTLPIGPSVVTTRDVYMSPVANQTRRLVATIADNVTATITIITPDALITGPAEPTADTSGLEQPNGQVNPGATVLPVAWSGPFRPSGGWVTLAGGQVVRHTGISGNTLTGIPAAGAGSITTTVLYGQQAIPAAMLVGVTGIGRAMLKGAAVHLWIQRDHLQAQAEHAARTGGDGVVEFLIVDARRGVESLAARCEADLALFARPIVTVAYATRDLHTKSGKTIAINLSSPAIVETLTIQEVTITEIGIAPHLAPRFTVKASSVRFSLEDTLRRLVAVGPVNVNG